MRRMKNTACMIGLMIVSVLLMMSCMRVDPKIRKSDVSRLTEEAANGSMAAKRSIVMYGFSKFPAELKKQYLEELAEAGDYDAINVMLDSVTPMNLVMLKVMPKEMVDCMEYGVEKGVPNFMYRLAQEYGNKDSQYYDSLRADQLMRQAADSLHAYARRDIRKAEHKDHVTDRAVFAFSQIWHRDMADESLLCRFSNAAFQSSYGLLADSFLKLFTHVWWQCLLAFVIMIAGLLLALFGFIFLNGTLNYTAVTSSVYGLINGFILFFTTRFVIDDGLIVTNRCIGHFFREEGTFGWQSTMCLWTTWIWAVLLLAFFVKGIYDLWESGRLNVARVVIYVISFVLINVIYYIMFSTVSVFGQLVIGLIVFFLGAVVLDKLGILKILGSATRAADGAFDSVAGTKTHSQAMKEHYEAQQRQRMRDINKKTWNG